LCTCLGTYSRKCPAEASEMCGGLDMIRSSHSRTFYGYSCGTSDTCPYDTRAPRSFDRVLTSEAPGMRVLYIMRCGEWRLSRNFVGEGRASDIGKYVPFSWYLNLVIRLRVCKCLNYIISVILSPVMHAGHPFQ